MNKLYPLKFTPIPKEKVWGGKYLRNEVFTDAEGEMPIGESVDLCGLENESSMISNGMLAENPIDDVIETYLGDILGDENYQEYGNLLPIIIKRLDIGDRLSVQIHPDDETAMNLYNSYGKSEIWYVTDADPDAKIWVGFNREMTATEVYNKCKDGTIIEDMNLFHPKKGDFFMIHAGTPHACGDGVRIFEISEASDITYRLYDWDKERRAKGMVYTPRETHLDLSLDVIDYRKMDLAANTGNVFAHCCDSHKPGESHSTVIADDPHFKIRHFELNDALHIYSSEFNSFITYSIIEGAAHIDYNGTKYELVKGDSVLIPAVLSDFILAPDEKDTEIVECYVPKKEEHDDYINPGVPFREEGVNDDEEFDEEEECGCGCHDHHDGECTCGHDDHDCGCHDHEDSKEEEIPGWGSGKGRGPLDFFS